MESYKLILLRDQLARPVQIAVPRALPKIAGGVAAFLALVFAVAVWDYWRLRADNVELDGLRAEVLEQREQITLFRTRLATVDDEITKVAELERKVRIIANLPGATGVGGEGVTELVPQGAPVGLPAGVPVDPGPEVLNGQGGGQPLPAIGVDVSGVEVLEELDGLAVSLSEASGERLASLESLLDELNEKRQRLASMPSIWPAKGWLTSAFGPRVSPFTGRKQLHAGIDIAAASGTSIYAPARARVSFVGKKGPLGNTVVLDHGFGVKTVYGHTKEIHVSTGETVERGQEIAAIGSTGRSTGPHLHYVVEVDGRPRDPLDYIFD